MNVVSPLFVLQTEEAALITVLFKTKHTQCFVGFICVIGGKHQVVSSESTHYLTSETWLSRGGTTHHPYVSQYS